MEEKLQRTARERYLTEGRDKKETVRARKAERALGAGEPGQSSKPVPGAASELSGWRGAEKSIYVQIFAYAKETVYRHKEVYFCTFICPPQKIRSKAALGQLETRASRGDTP